MKKVLLYLASNSPFYTNLYPSIKRGFEEAGCLVEGGPNLLESEALIQKIETFQPDFVFEMNRVKSEIENFPDTVMHICWLVDFWGRRAQELTDSDILYVWSNTWIDKFKEIGVKNVYYLPPATDVKVYEKSQDRRKINDFLFLGHISKPWKQEELNRRIKNQKNTHLMFRDVLKDVKKYVLSSSVQKPFLDVLEEKGIIFDLNTDKALMYDIFSRSFRQIRREHFLNIFLKNKKNITIYGSENWSIYDQYKIFYKGYIENPKILNEAIQQSRILLHDHYDPHFRTFDAMACGTLVVSAQEKENMIAPFKLLGFEDKEDYIKVDIYAREIDLSILNNIKKLEDIAHNAKKKVLQKHLWVHRVEKILEDIKNMRSIHG